MALKYLYAPSGAKAGTAYGVLPNSASADFSSFSRNGAGSRVDKNGFINTGLGLGSEEVVDGGFDNASSWATTVATISNSRAIFIDGTGAYSNVRQGGVLTINKTYEVTIDVVINSGGGLKIQDGSGNTYKRITESGVHTFRFTSIGASSSFYIARDLGGVAYDMYVERVSVREVTEVNTDVPRIDHTGGGCPSLLLEPTSTNYIQYSEDFSQSYWTNTGSYNVVYENNLNPKGDLGYYKLTGTTVNDQIRTPAIPVGSSVNDFTLSILVKNIDSESIRLDLSDTATGDSYIDFFFATETLGNAVNGGSWTNAKGSFTKLKDGWYYVSLTATKNAGSNIICKIVYGNDSASLFAAQLEQQSYPTSYIPNYGTAAGVTRSEDVGGSTGDLSNVINSTEGVLYINVAALSSNGSSRRITLNDGTTSNRLIFQYSSTSNQINYYFVVGGTNQCSMSHTLSNAMDYSKVALKYKENDFALWVNGVEVGTDNSGNTLSAGTLNSLNFDGATGNYPFYGKAKEIRIYDKYESNAEIEELTSWSSLSEMAQALNYKKL